MSEIYSDDNGQRIVNRHTGPPGRGIPAGGTAAQVLVKVSGTDYDTEWSNPSDPLGAIVGPASATDGAVVLFDGTTGELAKDSTRTLSWFASRTYVDTTFEPKVSGKGLSKNDFTDVDKAKLDALSETGLFFGNFADLTALEESLDVPVAGSYATVDGTPATLYFWDATEEVWISSAGADKTGEELALEIFNDVDSASYAQATCRIFTTDYLVMLEAHDAALSGVGTTAHGMLSYFNTTGTSLTFAGASDGTTNMTVANVASALDVLSVSFDNGGANNGRIRYTGSTTRLFRVSVRASEKGASADELVFGIAKNGTVVAASKQMHKSEAAGGSGNVACECIVSLALNDYIELYVGNMTDTTSTSVTALTIVVDKV